MSVLRDSISSAPLLTGATLAGALRHYLCVREHGHGKKESNGDLTDALFGGQRSAEEGAQSLLLLNDARGDRSPILELRDGVRIAPYSRTAADKGKYDLELLAAGTTFALLCELLIPWNDPRFESADEAQRVLRRALAIALQGLSGTFGRPADIGMGRGKSRGFGRCHVGEWHVWEFDLTQAEGRLAWLGFDPYGQADQTATPTAHLQATFVRDGLPEGWPTRLLPTQHGTNIAAVLGVDEPLLDDRDVLQVRATFHLDGPLLIRAGQDETGPVPDVAYLRSRRINEFKKVSVCPVVSGTSLAGVLRHRAERIMRTLNVAPTIVEEVFGFTRQNVDAHDGGQPGGEAQASRLIVHESTVEGTTQELIQQRVSIDRFTGGAYPGALFAEGVLVGSADATVTLELELRNPKKEEIGLVLLLLKDLWTGDLPLGGTSSIGRGRLRGQAISIATQQRTWTIEHSEGQLAVNNAEELNDFVTQLLRRRTAV